MRLELIKLLAGRENSIQFGKNGRVSKCFDDILAYISQRTNSVFHINTFNQEYGVYINTCDHQNDHTKNYRITISQSCETYKVDEIIYLEKILYEPRIEFDKSKL